MNNVHSSGKTGASGSASSGPSGDTVPTDDTTHANENLPTDDTTHANENLHTDHTVPTDENLHATENVPAEDGTVNKVIEMRGVAKVFNSGMAGQVEALSEIDLAVEPGEFVTLIGPSGCGKSTLLRLIASLVEPSTGTVQVNGKPAEQARLDRDYGMAFQTAGLFDWRTVTKNIQLPLELMGWSRAERRRRATEMLELVKLSEFADHHPSELSGGMQQRVSIARALAFSPALLLMDEPFGALDEMSREHMQDELLWIWKETETTVVLVTHSIPEAVYLSTRVVVMSPRPGRIASTISVDLGERSAPTRDDPAFFNKVTEVRSALRKVET